MTPTTKVQVHHWVQQQVRSYWPPEYIRWLRPWVWLKPNKIRFLLLSVNCYSALSGVEQLFINISSRSGEWWNSTVPRFSDGQWTACFRLSKEEFEKLFLKIENDIKPSKKLVV